MSRTVFYKDMNKFEDLQNGDMVFFIDIKLPISETDIESYIILTRFGIMTTFFGPALHSWDDP